MAGIKVWGKYIGSTSRNYKVGQEPLQGWADNLLQNGQSLLESRTTLL